MQPNGGFAPATSGFISVVNPYEKHFDSLNSRKEIDLGDGYIAVPIWNIRRRNQSATNSEEESRAKLLNFNWIPKGGKVGYPQRCPFIWVDNIIFLYQEGMSQPHLLIGRWKKQVEIYGTLTELEGLVLAGGGHYERMAKKGPIYDNMMSRSIMPEGGDFSLRAAADKELGEEIGIDPRNVKATRELGMMDDVFSDPRCHGLRAGIYLRWIDQAPRSTEELKSVIAIPVDQLHRLYNNTDKWKFPDGKEFGFILNHDKLIRMIMKHPDTMDFLALIKTFPNANRQANGGLVY